MPLYKLEKNGYDRSEAEHSGTGKGVRHMKPMEYQQVKERVEREDKILKKLVVDVGIGMLAALLIALAVFH